MILIVSNNNYLVLFNVKKLRLLKMLKSLLRKRKDNDQTFQIFFNNKK